MAKPFAVERALELSASMTLIGVILAAISLADIIAGTTGLGGWSYWTVIVGLIVFAFGLHWLAGYLRNVRDFKRILEEQSKAAFVKDLDDAEYLAWKLPTRFEDELFEKKRRFGMK